MSAIAALEQNEVHVPYLEELQSGASSDPTEQLVESRMKKVAPYMVQFKKWADETGASFQYRTLINWDHMHNNSKIQSLLGSAEERLEVGTREMYRRVFYMYFRVNVVVDKLKNIVINDKDYVTEKKKVTMVLSQVRRGDYLPTMDADRRKYQIDCAVEELIAAANRLLILKMPLASIHLALDKGVSGTVQ